MVSGWAGEDKTSIQQLQDPQMMTTNSWEEVLLLNSNSNSNSWDWLVLDQQGGRNWTPEENKCFEEALAFFDSDTPDRWQRVASMIPGKTPADVFSHYNDLEQDVRQIEEGLVPFPFSPYADDWPEYMIDQPYQLVGGKRSARPEHERKKGVPWTEEEHRLFLMGLEKYGKGDWRDISRNYVVSRTPTQVASHAQKYFIRLNSSGTKDKRRSSIHDITTVNNSDNKSSSEAAPSINNSPAASSVNNINQPTFMQQPYNGTLMSQHGLHSSSMVAHHALLYQMQTVQPRLHG